MPSNLSTTNTSWSQPLTTRQQIYHTAFILRQRLPPDLIGPILHHAEILEVSTSKTSHEYAVLRENSPYTYCITDQVKCAVRLESPVVKVMWRIVARDEGLNLNIGRSWFTAGIVRGHNSGSSGVGKEERCRKDGVHSVPGRAEEDEPFFVSSGSALRDGMIEDESEVVENFPACDVMQTHVVVWHREESGWVRSLRNGDRIAVRAYAKYATLENRISSVEIELWHTAVR